MWQQIELELPSMPRGFHLITEHIIRQCPEIKKYKVGLMHVFIKHTSASLTINENADPDVRHDLESYLHAITPEDAPYFKHMDEGSDDMPAHIKASLLGSSVTIPITHGALNLGLWQGIYLGEHRNVSHGRQLVITLSGE